MAEPDWDDPCAIVTWLRPQLYAVAAGTSVVDVRGSDGNRVAYGQGNYQELMQLFRGALSECAKKTGSKIGRRRAFTGRIMGS